jgi:hypothetical protein
MTFLDALPESFGTALAAVFVVIPLIALVIMIFRFLKQRKKDRQ